MLIITVDANFRLKNLHCSNDKADPGLHTGLAYFVDDVPYKAHYRRFASQKDVSYDRRSLVITHEKQRLALAVGFVP